jgi:hypothetical protein
MENEPSPAASDGERRPTGQFGPGNRFGKGGNPYLRRIKFLKAHLLAAATPEQVRAVIVKMGEQAAAGDVASAKVYLDHVLGRPGQTIQLTDPDGEPLGTDLARLRSVILGALADFPEARFKVARALLDLSSGGPGDGPGPAGDAGG